MGARVELADTHVVLDARCASAESYAIDVASRFRDDASLRAIREVAQ